MRLEREKKALGKEGAALSSAPFEYDPIVPYLFIGGHSKIRSHISFVERRIERLACEAGLRAFRRISEGSPGKSGRGRNRGRVVVFAQSFRSAAAGR